MSEAVIQRLIWFNLQRDGTRNGLFNIKETFAENLPLQMSVLQQSMNIVQGWYLKFMAGKNVEKTYLMCQIPIKMLIQHAILNSNLHNLKFYSRKWCIKTIVKDEYM